MATKKILTYDGLVEYNELVMTEISTGDGATLASAKSYADSLASGKSDSSHTHDDRYYTEAEIDSKVSTINSNITKITNGTTVVKNAEHATSADSATTATSAGSATKATQDESGNVITKTYETKTDASAKLDEAKAYAESVGTTVKNDLLNGAGEAYDTLKELGVLIDDNADAIETLKTVASGKANKTHSHAISDVSGLQSALDEKAASSHGTHVTWSTTSPKMNGTAAVGTETKVARGDHVHPTDTSRASQVALDEHIGDTTKHITSTERTNLGTAYTHSQAAHAPSNAQANVIESIKVNGTAQTITSKSVNITVPTDNVSLANGAGYITASAITNKADKATTLSGYGITNAYTKAEVDAKTVVDTALSSSSTNPVQNKVVNSAISTATNAINTNTSSINAHTTRISSLETKVGDGFVAITSAEIQSLFSA